MQAHKKVLMELDETNKRRVLDKNGEYVTSHTFEEAFPHHVHFTMCRARGIFAGKLVNHQSYTSFGDKLSRAAEIAGTLHTIYNVGKTVAPVVMRLGSALI